MHELSMAQGILNAVIENAEKSGATEVKEVTIEIGKLAHLNPEQLKFLLDVLTEDTIAEGTEFIMEEIPIEIECDKCDYVGIAKGDDSDFYSPIVECPNCENKFVNVTNGKDCIVKNIIIEKPDD